MSYCRDIGEKWLNPRTAKAQQRLASETQEERAFFQKKIWFTQKAWLISKTLHTQKVWHISKTLLERAARFEEIAKHSEKQCPHRPYCTLTIKVL